MSRCLGAYGPKTIQQAQNQFGGAIDVHVAGSPLLKLRNLGLSLPSLAYKGRAYESHVEGHDLVLVGAEVVDLVLEGRQGSEGGQAWFWVSAPRT